MVRHNFLPLPQTSCHLVFLIPVEDGLSSRGSDFLKYTLKCRCVTVAEFFRHEKYLLNSFSFWHPDCDIGTPGAAEILNNKLQVFLYKTVYGEFQHFFILSFFFFSPHYILI